MSCDTIYAIPNTVSLEEYTESYLDLEIENLRYAMSEVDCVSFKKFSARKFLKNHMDSFWFNKDHRKVKRFYNRIHRSIKLIRIGKCKSLEHSIMNFHCYKVDGKWYESIQPEIQLIRVTDYPTRIIRGYKDLINFIDFYYPDKIRYKASYQQMKEFFNTYPEAIIFFT